MKKELEKAHEVSELKVGRYYLVAVAVCHDGTVTKPIIPIIHSDHFAKHVGEHYHYDTRFFNNGFVNYTNDVLIASNVARIEYVKKKCKRLEGGIHLEEVAWGYNRNEYMADFIEWYDKMQGVDVKTDTHGNHICPHKGAIMAKVGDKFVCPMHRLKACAKTKKIIDRREEGFWSEFENDLQK